LSVHQSSECDVSKFPARIAAEQMTDAEARHSSKNVKKRGRTENVSRFFSVAQTVFSPDYISQFDNKEFPQ